MTQKRLRGRQKIQKSHSNVPGDSQDKTDTGSGLNSLRDQYLLIRDDLVKLRADLQKGYTLAKSSVEKKSFLRQWLRGE
jgi:hypothetical protein